MDRFFDILFSGLALILFTPLFVIIVVTLKLSGEGEVLFLQERVGKGGKKFKLFKFVTMQKNSPNIGTGTVTIKNDPRVLPVGKFLRKTKMNELPQLLNVLFGDMSIVGPRPLTTQTFEAYLESTQYLIVQVRPGLSGLGSIIFRNEDELMYEATASIDYYINTIAPFKGALEEWYVLNKSLYIYFLVIIVTVWVIIIPNTKLVWKIFKALPKPPAGLEKALKFIN